MLCMSAYGVIMNVCFAAVLLIAFAQHACYLLWQTSPCGPRNRAGECSYPLPARGIHATQQQFSLRIPPSSVEVLGMFRSFCFAPFSIVYLNTFESPIFTRKILALSVAFFIEKILWVCYNNSTL